MSKMLSYRATARFHDVFRCVWHDLFTKPVSTRHNGSQASLPSGPTCLSSRRLVGQGKAVNTKKEQNIAAAQSSVLNAAYRTLLSPVLRAQYILTQEGFEPSETDKLTDQELVMEIMEAREELDEAETLENIERIRSENGGKVEEMYASIAKLIGEMKWEDARDAVVKLKYLEGIQSAAEDKWHTLSR
ncbi:hypothetical protein EW145_g874 [Phellinidium pouzarii]|uniref:Co-chaperone HscB C-terminal oligomerisation domain-containing protein n=1 Tax=Phellinidium pouzarii TaxID=167371 RepID=A0A4S4LGP0_9AGAM|nr:hypothetical protein EW145_g874 [Phellinidium pouzarii]